MFAGAQYLWVQVSPGDDLHRFTVLDPFSTCKGNGNMISTLSSTACGPWPLQSGELGHDCGSDIDPLLSKAGRLVS